MVTRQTRLNSPPKKLEKKATPSATPDRPFRARGCPSRLVTMAAGLPGMLSRMAEMLPPRHPADENPHQKAHRRHARHVEGERQQENDAHAHRETGNGRKYDTQKTSQNGEQKRLPRQGLDEAVRQEIHL